MTQFIFPVLFLISIAAFANRFQIRKNCYIKPCEYKGDFDGDNRTDLAVLITNKDGKKGIEISFANKKTAFIGAGEPIGNGGATFDWMERWTLHKKKIEQGATESKKPPTPKGDSLLLEKINSASGLVYWDGFKFQWYQQGD